MNRHPVAVVADSWVTEALIADQAAKDHDALAEMSGKPEEKAEHRVKAAEKRMEARVAREHYAAICGAIKGGVPEQRSGR